MNPRLLMNRLALSRTARLWIILALLLLAIALYFSYRERARFSPEDSSPVVAGIKTPTYCPSYPDPSFRCDSPDKIVCIKDNEYCKCTNGFWINNLCPAGRPCKNNEGCVSSS